MRDEAFDAERRNRQEARDAVAMGSEAPVRPDAVDPVRREAEVQVEVEDATDLREELNEAVVELLGVLRSNRLDLDLSTLSPPLLMALSVGGANLKAAMVARAQEDLAELADEAS